MLKPVHRACLLIALVVALSATFPATFASPEVPAGPAAPGSIGPRLAVTPEGALLMSWVEPAATGHALRFSTWQDTGWSPPETVASGANWFVNWADFPAVMPIDDAFWTAHWLVRRPAGGYAYDVHVAVSRDGGDSWSTPRVLHDDDTDTEHGFATHFPSAEGAGLVWLDGRQTATPGGGMTLRTATLSPEGDVVDGQLVDDLICDCCQTDVAVASSGPVAVYRNRTRDEIRDIYVARQVDGKWQAGVPVANDGWRIDGCPVNGPAIAAAGDVVAVAWFTAADGNARVNVAFSVDSGQRFGEPVVLPSSGVVFGRVRTVLLPDGSAIVSFLDKPADHDFAVLAVHRVSRDGDVSTRTAIAANVRPFSVPQLALAQGKLVAAWTAIEGDQSHIRTRIVPLDALPEAGAASADAQSRTLPARGE